jgi:hypothetical protein
MDRDDAHAGQGVTPFGRGLSGVDLDILSMVQSHPCHGMTHLAAAVCPTNRTHVRRRVIRLEEAGLLKVEIPPVFGRGHKIIIRRADGK